jgi:hypothetical protein
LFPFNHFICHCSLLAFQHVIIVNKPFITVTTLKSEFISICSFINLHNVGCKKALYTKYSKGLPRQAEVALGVPGRLRPRIFSTFGTTRMVGRQPNAPAAFTPEEIPGTHFQKLIRPQGTWFCWKETRKKSPVTPPGIDPGTVRLVAQRLNHYATPGPGPICQCF